MGFISSDSLVFRAFAIQFGSAFFWFCCGSSSSPLVLSADTEGDSLGCLVLLGHLLQRAVGRSHCACVSLCHWAETTGIVIFRINHIGSHRSRTRTRLAAFRAASVHHCLNLWKLLCGLLVFISLEFVCLFLGTSNHII